MKLIRKNFYIWENDIYVFPTFRIVRNNSTYVSHIFSIEFHWLIYHMRLLFKWVKVRKNNGRYRVSSQTR